MERDAVRRFRCRIAGLMAVVALAALDCAAVRSPLSGRPLTETLLLLGGLPMANVLAFGLLLLLLESPGRGACRPWLVGFETVGWSVLLLYAFCAFYHPEALRGGVVGALSWLNALGNPVFLAAAVAVLISPQLSLAMLGGWLNRKFS
jgi:hypothetical protein